MTTGDRRAPGHRVTIAMVAREAGVSVPTVSKVLNGKEEVNADTRRRVQDVLAASGYRRRGRGPVGRVGLVDFVITELDTPWATELLRGAEQEAYRSGVSLVLTVTHDRRDGPREWLRTIESRPTDGVVLVLSTTRQVPVQRLPRAGTPLVVVDQIGGFDRGLPTIGAANYAGGFAATTHLAELGHRRIAMVTGPGDVPCSQQRLDGYRAALTRAGQPVVDQLVREGNFHRDGGRAAAAELLDLPEPPTAVFAGNDVQARGVYDEAHARGLRIPQDLSVVGFDDVDVCDWMTPGLTTVRQPLAQMAALAIRNVLESRQSSDEPPLRLELSTSLVVRESTTRAPSGARRNTRRPGRTGGS